MKNVVIETVDKLHIYKRSIVESAINKLKSVCQIEHHRHRPIPNFMTNLLSGIAAYSLDAKKPVIEGLYTKNSPDTHSSVGNHFLNKYVY